LTLHELPDLRSSGLQGNVLNLEADLEGESWATSDQRRFSMLMDDIKGWVPIDH